MVLLLAYAGFLFLLPNIVNSASTISKIEAIVLDKTQLELDLNGLKFKPEWNLAFNLQANEVILGKFLKVNDVSIDFAPLKLMPKKVAAQKIYFDKTQLPVPDKKSEKKNSFNLKSIPDLSVKSANVILDNSPNNYFSVNLDNVGIAKSGDKREISFNSVIKNKQIQHDIILNSNSNLFIKEGAIFAEDFEIKIHNTALVLNGKMKGKQYDFNVKGRNLCVNALEKAFLTFMKQKNPKKNFIENFYAFEGRANVDLNLSNGGLNGNVLVKDLGTKTVMFSVPLYFENANFIFEKDTISLDAAGLLGNEPAFADLSITDLFTDKKVKGSVTAVITKEMAQTYLPDFKLDGKLDAKVDYFIHNKKPVVEYQLSLPEGTRLGYRTMDLGLIDSSKRIYAKTLKDGDNLSIQNYDYSYVDGDNISNIIVGDGLFRKQNGKMVLDYVTCKTKGEAPVSIIGTFSRFVEGGTFRGDLKYSGIKKLLTGNFRLINSHYKNFIVDVAQIKADDNNMLITAEGTYENEPYSCLLDMKNQFEDDIFINDINLYLKKYTIVRPQKTCKTKKKIHISDKVKDKLDDTHFTIEKGKVKLDELKYKDILLNNIELIGSLKEDNVEFIMPSTKFAQGTLYAQGSYDIIYSAADINFSAENINSNLAADMLFGLKNQVEGYANASMRVLTFDKLDTILAYVNFAIADGALTKIGSTEFMVKNKKFKIIDITNVDIKKMEALRSNIAGSFDVNDQKIENAEIFAKQKYLSLFVEGNYDIQEQDASLNVWGAYNKDAQKGIKILFVPLSVITKIVLRPEKTLEKYQKEINKIPSISADSDQKEFFVVRMKGDLNGETSKKINVQLKKLTN